MCYHCNNATKRFIMQRKNNGIIQTAGLCMRCHAKRGSDYESQGWKIIVEDVILTK